jgi:hypothetical protein
MTIGMSKSGTNPCRTKIFCSLRLTKTATCPLRLVGWSAALVGGATGFAGSSVGAGLTASPPLGAASVGRGSPWAGAIGADAVGALVGGIAGALPASLASVGCASVAGARCASAATTSASGAIGCAGVVTSAAPRSPVASGTGLGSACGAASIAWLSGSIA